VRRHDLQNEAESEENAATPPADLGEDISRLTDSDERVRGGACPSEARGEAGPLPALQQNGQHHDEAIDDEQYQKKRVKH
jgi:hypothetical protein